jgi:PD-(D/E)XK nuclease family transposase
MLAMTNIIFDGLLDVIGRYTSRHHTKEEPSERFVVKTPILLLPRSDKEKKGDYDRFSNGINRCPAVEPKKVPYPPSFNRVPSYISKAYSRFASHVNESDELNGLKFIGILRVTFGMGIDPYIWHHTEKSTNTHGKALKEFSYSIVGLEDFAKKNKSLKTIQDKWLTLLVRGSEMTENEVEEMFGDEPMFLEIFQILKLDNLTPDQRQRYYRAEEIRHLNVNSMRSDYEKDVNIQLDQWFFQQIDRLKNSVKLPPGATYEDVVKLGLEHARIIKTQLVINMLNSGMDIELVSSLIKWPKEQIEKVKQDISNEEAENQESERIADQKRKQIAMDMLRRGFNIREIGLLTKWTDDDIKRLKEEVEDQ